MCGLVSTLTIRLQDDVSGPAAKVAAALKRAGESARAMARTLDGSGASKTFTNQLARMGLSAREVEKVSAALREYTRTSGMAAKASDWTKADHARVRAWEAQTIASLKHVKAEERATANARHAAAAGFERTSSLFRQAAPYLAPIAVAAELRREVKTYADLEKAMTSLGNTAEASDEQVSRATERFRREGPPLGAPPAEMAKAGELYVAAGLDFDTAIGSVAKTVKATKASGGELNDLASAGIAAMQQFGFKAESLDRAFDIMAKGGKLGRYELKSMAKDMPAVGAGAKRLGLEGEKGLAKTVAALEVIRDSVGSPEEAANRWNNVVQKEFIQETQKNFKKFGVNLEQKIKNGAKKGIDALDVLLDATERVAKGDQFKLGQLFNDAQAMEGIQALTRNRQKLRDLTGKILTESGGTIARDFDRVSKTTTENFERLAAAWDRATGRLGEALAPAANRLADTINQALDKIDKGETLFNRLEKERRAREDAAGRDPDADRKEREADEREQAGRVLDFERRWTGNPRGLNGVFFPTQEEIDEGVRKAREAGRREKEERDREIIRRPGDLNSELRRKQKELDALRASPLRAMQGQRGPVEVALKAKEAEIARLTGELALARQKAAQLHMPPNAPAPGSPGEFGNIRKSPLPPERPADLGDAARPAPSSSVERTVPLPPRRPVEFGGSPAPAQQVTVNGEMSGSVTGEATVNGTVQAQTTVNIVVTASSELISAIAEARQVTAEGRGVIAGVAALRGEMRAAIGSANAAAGAAGAAASRIRQATHNNFVNVS